MFGAWLAVSVVFALTPCCEIYAALMPATAPAPDHAALSHGHTDGDDGSCATWLDRNDVLPVEGSVLPAPTPTIPAAFTLPLPPASFAVARAPFPASVSPPDALYLRYLRLIL